MKYFILLLALIACKPDKPTPGPTPDDPVEPTNPDDPAPIPDDPTPEPQPAPIPVTCLGEQLGTIKEKPCDAGYEGKLVLVCTAAGWTAVSNTCVKPAPIPPKPVEPVTVRLPEVYRIVKGDSVALGVKPQVDVVFKWSTGETGEVIWVTPAADKQYTVNAMRKDGGKGTASVTVIVQ